MLDDDALLARWCEDHHGIITLTDADALGVDPDVLFRRQRAGVLVRAHPGVYRHAAHPPTFLARLAAAVAASGPGAFVSGPSLMRLHGVRGTWTDRPELVLARDDHIALAGVRLRRIDHLDQLDARRHAGFPVLSMPLGLLLLGASVPSAKVETAVHDAVFLGLTALPRLVDVAVRYGGRGRDGIVAFRHAVGSLDPKGRATQTNLELVALRSVRDGGYPEPLLQHVVVDGDGRRRRLDLAWPELGLDVETDGDRWHLNPRDQAAIKVRDAALLAVGWHTERLDSRAVADGRGTILRRLQPFFGAGAALGAAPAPENGRAGTGEGLRMASTVTSSG